VINGSSTTRPTILLGILEGSTVVARGTPIGGVGGTTVANVGVSQEIVFAISGLAAGSHTWDAAYDVETLVASTNIQYGGPNDTTANNAWGGFCFEIFEAPNLLAQVLYDPATAVSQPTTAALAMTALDTTNLRLTFTAPSSGNVMIRMGGCVSHGATTFAQVMLGVLQGSTIIGRGDPIGSLKTSAVNTAMLGGETSFIVTGLTPGSNYTWDAAYDVELGVASTGLKYGGPNDTTANNAFGGFFFEIWGV
jgi:hypothetical protein